MAVPIRLSSDGPAVGNGVPVPLFATHVGEAVQDGNRQQYMVSPTGLRILHKHHHRRSPHLAHYDYLRTGSPNRDPRSTNNKPCCQNVASPRTEERWRGMKPERWRQIEQLYDRALEIEESRRTSFLREACAGDDDLRRELEQLLAEGPQASSFLEEPALREIAHEFVATAGAVLDRPANRQLSVCVAGWRRGHGRSLSSTRYEAETRRCR